MSAALCICHKSVTCCFHACMIRTKDNYHPYWCHSMVHSRALHGPKNHSPAWSGLLLLRSVLAHFLSKIFRHGPFQACQSLSPARPGLARPVNEMNAHYKQFLSCFLENLFLAKTSKLEITAVAVSLYRMNNSLAKAKNEETV